MDSQREQSATTTTSSEMIQFSESYNAQTIFDQVWEAPYSWFDLPPATEQSNTTLPCVVLEVEDEEVLSETFVTAGMIEAATVAFYMDYVSKIKGPWKRTMASYLEDLDANDVDAILQLACFGEIRYG